MIRLSLSLAFVLFALAPPLSAAAKVSEPEAVIIGIYQAYGPDSFPENPYEEHFTPGLLKLWDEVEEGAGDDVEYAIDFDVFLDAQDVDMPTDISTKLTPAGKDKGNVDITFTAFGERRTMHYTMVRIGSAWKIDNIAWGPDRSDLRTLLAELKKGQANR